MVVDELSPLTNASRQGEFGSTELATGSNQQCTEEGATDLITTRQRNSRGNNREQNTAEDFIEDGSGLLSRRKSSRGSEGGGHHRRDSSLMEIALESLHDISDAFVEKLEDVQTTIVEGMEEIQEVLEVPVAEPVKPREEGDHSKKLGALAVAILVFYKVSGGPFGCEPAVKAAGPFYALLGFTIFPILWCIPEALVTAELGSAFPEPSGSIAWVEEAFGPQLSLLAGYFHWVSGATDNAIYPALFLRYVSAGTSFDDLTRYLFTVAMTLVLSCINFSGLDLVGNLSMVVCIISMSPFIIMTVLAIPKLDMHRWLQTPNESSIDTDDFDDDGVGLIPAPTFAGVLWRPLLNSLFWNLNSFDVGASFAGELRDPKRVFAPAMFLSIGLVWLSYLIPLLAALGATDAPQSAWDAGYFTEVASEIGGDWLGIWLIVASAISNVALFEAEMSGDAYQLMGMADRGMIPKVFAQRSRFGTPTNGIMLGTLVIIALGVADFDQLVEMLNFAVALAMLLEFSAFVKLRITHDDVERPYRVPLSTFGCILFVLPPMTFLIYLMLIASRQTYLYLLGLILFGVFFYFAQKVVKHYGWIEYVEAPKRERRGAAPAPGAAATEQDQ